jgi:hypothetical protein
MSNIIFDGANSDNRAAGFICMTVNLLLQNIIFRNYNTNISTNGSIIGTIFTCLDCVVDINTTDNLGSYGFFNNSINLYQSGISITPLLYSDSGLLTIDGRSGSISFIGNKVVLLTSTAQNTVQLIYGMSSNLFDVVFTDNTIIIILMILIRL